MSKFNYDMENFADNYVDKFKNVTDRIFLTEEIDAAYARANSIEKNRDMKNSHNLSRKKAWIKIAKKLQEIRDGLA